MITMMTECITVYFRQILYNFLFRVYIFVRNQSECVPLVVYVFTFGVNQSECIFLVSSAYNVGVYSAPVMMLKMRMIMLLMKMRVKMRMGVGVATSSVSQELLQHPPDILDRCLTTAGILDRCLPTDMIAAGIKR